MLDAHSVPARGRCGRPGLTLMALLALLLALALPGAARAAVTPATLTMTSDAGDYVGQGAAYAYDTTAGDTLTASGDRSRVHVSIDGANGDWWYLDLAAPTGAQLAPGASYPGATRYPFQLPSAPGLALFGNGRGCNTLTGSFVVHDVAYGAGDVVTRLHATFEQHCEGAAPALRGTIDLGAPPPPPPPPLEIAATIDPTGTVNRRTSAATIGGTVTCSAAARATIAGTITQGSRKAVVTVPFSVAVDCSPAAAPWRVTVNGSLVAGAAKVDLTATAPDPNSAAGATSAASRTIELKRQ